MLTEVAEGVWVRQSEWVWTNSTVVRVDDGLVLVDPGITGAELEQLADDVDALGVPVVAGFSTHPHWDHLLWHPRFGDVPRYATAAGARFAGETLDQQREGAQEEGGPDIALDLVGLVTPLPAGPDLGQSPIPGELVEHRAHCVGHAALLLADRGVLLAGDMLSDILIPIFDPLQDDQLTAYETALAFLDDAARRADVAVAIPGHGSVATTAAEVTARLATEHAYIDALRRGEDPSIADPRMGPDAEWLDGIHRGNVERALRAR